MTRQHYHLTVSTPDRDYAFIARTKATVNRWVRHFKHYGYDLPGRGSIDTLACAGPSCIAMAPEILH